MKKSILTLLGVGLLLTSCQSDEPFAPGEGGEKQVTFTLNLPGEMGTRANEGYNSGKGGITNLNQQINYTLVLEANGDKRVFTNVDATNFTTTTATFSPTVVLGRNYKVTAYATFDAEPVDVTEIAVSKSFNDESKDTYFKTVTHDFSTGELATLDLRRPFGKLRLVATDYKAGGTALNTEIQSVKVTYHDQQTATFNAVEGLFSYNGVNGDIEATKPFEGYYSSTADETTLFADYIPANSQDNMVDFTVEVKYADSEETYYRRFNDIPVRRNSLTTLKGAFFTAGAQITVNVDDNFEEQNLFEKTVTVTTNEELTNAIANAVDNELIIFGRPINGNVTAVQREGIDVTIDGKGFEYDGTIYIHGKSRNNGQETLTIQNVNFKASTSGRDFISANSTIESERYAHNVIVRNCSFEGNNKENVVAMRYRQTYNMKVENCVANNLFLLMWASGNVGTTIDGVTVNNPTGEGGVSIAKDTNVVIKNSTINAAGGYGIRAGGENATSNTVSNLSVENTTIEAKQPIVVRYAVGNHNVALSGADLITNELYHVIFTKGNNNANYEAPEGIFTISGADDYNVYPMQPGAEVKVRTQAQLEQVLRINNVTINLADGNYTFNGASGNATIKGSKNAIIQLASGTLGGGEVTFNGVTINTAGSGYNGINAEKVVYDNVTINGSMRLYRENVVFNNSVINLNGDYIWVYAAKNVEFKGCEFNTTGKAILIYNEGAGASKVKVEGCVFNASVGAKAGAIANQNCAAIEIDNFQTSGIGAAHLLNTTGNSVDSNFSGEWRIKNYVAGNPITVNGVGYNQIAIDGKLMTIDANKNVTVLN